VRREMGRGRNRFLRRLDEKDCCFIIFDTGYTDTATGETEYNDDGLLGADQRDDLSIQ